MSNQGLLPLGVRVRDSLLLRHAGWLDYVDVLATGDLEVAIPAPGGFVPAIWSSSPLAVRTLDRFSPPYACYCVESDREMHAVLEALLRDDAFFVVVTDGDEWLETTLLRPGQEPVLKEGQVANVLSWSGAHDKVITYTEKHAARKDA